MKNMNGQPNRVRFFVWAFICASIVCPAFADDPLTNPNPPSTLLPPNANEFTFSVQSSLPTQCRYALGTAAAFSDMTPFDSGDGTTTHQAIIHGLDPNANVINELYVRCAAYPDFILHQRYRCLAQTNPSYPRTGNLWGSWNFIGKGLPYCAKIDLWLGAFFTADQIRQLRILNPDIIILTSINAVEDTQNGNLPDDYYLKDIYGNRAEVWPGTYRLNLTKTYVAEYKAYSAYQAILDNDLMFDGCFFDNVMTTMSWFHQDIHGNNFIIDADENGIADNPAALDAAWKAGVFHELAVFRSLMPGAITSGHSMNIYESGISDIFNGISLGFATADVLEGATSFDQLWNIYNQWNTVPLSPRVTMFESSPQDQIAYGYGYSPWYDVPPETLEFARTYYPFVRFGLALTLMNDGYFAHELGDTWHGNDWWYDELDFDLGYPLGPAEVIKANSPPPSQNILINGSFDEGYTLSPWYLWANTGCAASVTRDLTQHTDGVASAKINITQTTGTDWHIEFAQYNCSFTKGTPYTLNFWAKADKSRSITLRTLKGSPDWDDYGLYQPVQITTDWQEYSVSFTANADTTQSRLQFWLGQTTGTVWLDNVRLQQAAPKILSREFTNGLVLLNASDQSQTIDLGPGYRRITGSQAPLYEYIIDDSGNAFSTTGTWTTTTYDSGLWKDAGPFYHDWASTCRQSNDSTSQARWNLNIPAPDTYSIYIWWPAAPSASSWCKNVTCQVVADGQAVSSALLDQSTAGDRWHLVAQVSLAPSDNAYVRLTGNGTGLCIADALHICSAARYNNGSAAPSVTLKPNDGIILEWTAVDGDINSDGIVNFKDFALLAACWFGPPSSQGLDIAPAAPDNTIDFLDLQQLASHWLNTN